MGIKNIERESEAWREKRERKLESSTELGRELESSARASERARERDSERARERERSRVHPTGRILRCGTAVVRSSILHKAHRDSLRGDFYFSGTRVDSEQESTFFCMHFLSRGAAGAQGKR